MRKLAHQKEPQLRRAENGSHADHRRHLHLLRSCPGKISSLGETCSRRNVSGNVISVTRPVETSERAAVAVRVSGSMPASRSRGMPQPASRSPSSQHPAVAACTHESKLAARWDCKTRGQGGDIKSLSRLIRVTSPQWTPGGLASRCQSRLHQSLRQSARQFNSFQQGPRGSRGRGGRYGIAFRLRSCGGSCGISRSLQNRPSGDHRPHSVQSRSRRHCRSRGRSGHTGSVTSSSALPTFPTLRKSFASRSGSLSRRFIAMLFCVRRPIPQLRSGSRIAVGLSLHLSTSCWNPSALSISQLVFSWSCCGDTSRI